MRTDAEVSQPRKLLIAVAQSAARHRAVVEALPWPAIVHPRMQAHVVLVVELVDACVHRRLGEDLVEERLLDRRVVDVLFGGGARDGMMMMRHRGMMMMRHRGGYRYEARWAIARAARRLLVACAGGAQS